MQQVSFETIIMFAATDFLKTKQNHFDIHKMVTRRLSQLLRSITGTTSDALLRSSEADAVSALQAVGVRVPSASSCTLKQMLFLEEKRSSNDGLLLTTTRKWTSFGV